MKRLFYLFAALFLLASCEDDNVNPNGGNPSLSDSRAITVTPPANITLEGRNLNAATAVELNGQALTIVSKTDTELEVRVPSGAFSGTAVVKFPDENFILNRLIKVVDPRVTTRPFEYNNQVKVDFLTNGNAIKYANGIIYRSTDGGTTWQNIYESVLISPSVPFRAFDANNIWVLLGGNKQLAITKDGGTTWNEITNLPNTIISDVFFLSVDKAVVTSVDLNAGKGAIYATSNGGQTWTKSYESSSAVVNNITLAYSGGNTMYLASSGSRLMLKSTDGGVTWAEYPLLVNLSTAPGTSQISFFTEQVGWAYNQPGISSGASGIYKTTNGGTSWSLISAPELDYDETITNLKFWADKFGVAITSKGGYMLTEDGGVNWRLYYMPGTNPTLVDLNQSSLYFYNGQLLVKEL